ARAHTGAGEAVVDRSGDVGIDRHLNGKGRRVRPWHAERRQQVPLILDRMPRPEAARPGDALGVHPASASHGVADARRRAAEPYKQRAARSAVKIDREIVAGALEAAREIEVGRELQEGGLLRRDDDVRDVRITLDYGRRRWLDDVSDTRVRKAEAQRANGR